MKVRQRPSVSRAFLSEAIRLPALIDALIDIDVAYEREREHLNLSCLDFLSRTRSLKRLREQHQQRRQPLVQQLVALQDGRDLRG
jgi:hypothetical protein